MADGDWHHIAVTVKRDSPTGGKFYVDGEPVPGPYGVFNPTNRPSSLTNNGALRPGSRSFSPPSGLYHGILDEVELFPRVLTPAEIQGIFQAGSNGKCKATPCVPPPAEMALWLPLDETSGTTAADIAGFPTNGTLSTARAHASLGWPAARTSTARRLCRSSKRSLARRRHGDFSLDAWIKTSDANYGVMTLVDQRIQPRRQGHGGIRCSCIAGVGLSPWPHRLPVLFPPPDLLVYELRERRSWPTGTGITSPSR